MNAKRLLKRCERIATKTTGESWGMSPTLHTPHAPAIIATLGERASYRFFEFFTANIRNPNTHGA
jgi:hypothetical protein